MGDSGPSPAEEEPNDFPTDDQVRQYSEACLKQQASNTCCERGKEQALDDPDAFMRQFLADHPDVSHMKYMGAGRYQIDYS